MIFKTFFKKFDTFADAPNAVAKMRELVLELAVTGKLVVQDKRTITLLMLQCDRAGEGAEMPL